MARVSVAAKDSTEVLSALGEAAVGDEVQVLADTNEGDGL